MGIGGGGDSSSDTDLEAVLEVSLKAAHRVPGILCYFQQRQILCKLSFHWISAGSLQDKRWIITKIIENALEDAQTS